MHRKVKKKEKRKKARKKLKIYFVKLYVVMRISADSRKRISDLIGFIPTQSLGLNRPEDLAGFHINEIGKNKIKNKNRSRGFPFNSQKKASGRNT